MPRVRYKLAEPFMNRNGSVNQTKDVYLVNGCVEKYKDKFYIVKRIGTTSAGSFPSPASGNPQGGFWYNGFFYGVFGDVLYRTGATQNTGTDGTAFTQATIPAWYGRAFFTATVFNNRIYVIGGEAPLDRADINYSADGVIWSQNASGAPFKHRQGHQVVVLNDTMFLLGGLEIDPVTLVGTVKNDVWSTTDGANWTLVTDNAGWDARDNFTAVVGNNGIYVYGGDFGGTGVFGDDVWFSVDGKDWTQLTNTATGTPRFLQSMFFFQNKVWIVCGDNGAGALLDDVWSSPDGQTWTLITSPAFGGGRSEMASTIYNNQMWLLAGTTAGGVTDSNVYSSGDGITWTLVTAAPGFGPRGGAAAVTFKTPYAINQYRYATIWLMGGANAAVDLQEVWSGDLNAALASSYALLPDTAGQSYQFNTFLNGTKLLIKNESNFWVLESGTLTKVVDTNYPSVTVPGIVVLHSFAYVMTPEGEINACALDDPLHWPSLQFTTADYEDDPGVAIIKYLNYLVAFGTYTMQLLYDAGNPAPGIALASYQSASIKIGLANAATLQSVKGTLIWVGQTESGRLSVYMMDGISPTPISTTWVDRVLNENLTVNTVSFVVSTGGHSFYVLNFVDSAQAFAFDVDMKMWMIWNAAIQFSPVFPYTIGVTDFVNGTQYLFGAYDLAVNILRASFDFYDDAGGAFDLIAQTDKIDADNLARKFCERLDWVSDQNPGNITIEVTDDDYQTYQTWGTVDQSLKRPALHRGGSFRRRAFRCTQTDSNPARWEALDLLVSQGES